MQPGARHALCRSGEAGNNHGETKCMKWVECVKARTLTKLVIPSRRSAARDLAIVILGSAASKAQIASERSLSVLRRIGMTTKGGADVRIARCVPGDQKC